MKTRTSSTLYISFSYNNPTPSCVHTFYLLSLFIDRCVVPRIKPRKVFLSHEICFVGFPHQLQNSLCFSMPCFSILWKYTIFLFSKFERRSSYFRLKTKLVLLDHKTPEFMCNTRLCMFFFSFCVVHYTSKIE